MSIYFLRHIKTVDNLLGNISGSSDSDILPEQSLCISCMMTERFDQIYCSPIQRCRDTIALLPTSMQKNLSFIPCLKERSLGILEGMNRTEAMQQFPHLFENKKLKVYAQIPGGESIGDVQRRISGFVDILLTNKDRQILVCSHNQTLKILLAEIIGISITDAYWQSVNFHNGEIICVDHFAQSIGINTLHIGNF